MHEPTSDRDLVLASNRGDLNAFARLVERHYRAVVGVAVAITRDASLAEDIAQETFAAAWTQLAGLRDPDRVRGWLCNIARNQSRNERRRRTRETPDDAVALAVADRRPTPADAMLAHETERELRAAVAEVPEAYRESLVLYYWLEQSIESVAAALDITEQAAQKRISRARRLVADGVARRLERAPHGRRTPELAAVAIVTLIASPTASAAAATKGTRMTSQLPKGPMIVAGAGALGLVGMVGLHLMDTHGAEAAPDARPAPSASHAPAGSSAARPRRAPKLPDGPASLGADDAASRAGGHGSPASYELTHIAPSGVAVNLSGGTSSMFGSDALLAMLEGRPEREALARSPRPIVRHLRGRVIDEDGEPIAGTVILAADAFLEQLGSIAADSGCVTDATGRFELPLHTATATTIVALDARKGWTPTRAVPAGPADAELEIQVPRPGTLIGKLRWAGEPVVGPIEIARLDRTFRLPLDTDARGQVELSQLPPGRYTVQGFLAGTRRHVERTVTIESGRTTQVTLELSDQTFGGLVAVRLRDRAAARTARGVEYILVPGRDRQLEPANLHALVERGAAHTIARGEAWAEIDNVAPGEYTLCADRIGRTPAQPVVCRTVVVKAGEPALEVELVAP